MIPCKECLKFPICRSKQDVICKDLFDHLIKTEMYSWNYRYHDRVEETLKLFDASAIAVVSCVFKRLTFSGLRYGYRSFLEEYAKKQTNSM